MSDSYYNRPIVLRVQVRTTDGEWIETGAGQGCSGEGFGSVEAAVAVAKRHLHGAAWRVVDAGGNVHEQGDRGPHVGAVSITDQFATAVRKQADELRSLVEQPGTVVLAGDIIEADPSKWGDGTVNDPAAFDAVSVRSKDGTVHYMDFKRQEIADEIGGRQIAFYLDLATKISKGRETVHVLESERRARLEASMREGEN